VRLSCQASFILSSFSDEKQWLFSVHGGQECGLSSPQQKRVVASKNTPHSSAPGIVRPASWRVVDAPWRVGKPALLLTDAEGPENLPQDIVRRGFPCDFSQCL
jgi:hypothetical protein